VIRILYTCSFLLTISEYWGLVSKTTDRQCGPVPDIKTGHHQQQLVTLLTKNNYATWAKHGIVQNKFRRITKLMK